MTKRGIVFGVLLSLPLWLLIVLGVRALAADPSFGGAADFGYYHKTAAGTFTVPRLDCTTGTNVVAVWVGIDNGSELDQAGVAAECGGQWGAWVENYPASAIGITDFPVRAGDRIYVRVTNGAASVDYLIINRTTGQRYTRSFGLVRRPGERQYVVEYPSGCQPAAFGRARFDANVATLDGVWTDCDLHVHVIDANSFTVTNG